METLTQNKPQQINEELIFGEIDLHPDFIPLWTEVNQLLQEYSGHQTRCNVRDKLAQERGQIDYHSHCTCIMGEAHGFNSKFMGEDQCDYCINSSYHDAIIAMVADRGEFLIFKNKLYEHMKNVHWSVLQ